MPKRTRAGALTALAGAALVAGTALAAPAAAAPKAPGFLKAADLPPRAGTSWTAGKVTAGIPDEVKQDMCIGVGLGGGQDSWYRKFRTDLDTSARQVSAELPSVRLAKGRFAKLDEDIVSCADRIEMADPQIQATFQDHGTLPVGDGAHVYALRTVTAWGTSDIRLISIGREGRTVTVVDWGQLGGFVDAPVQAFKKTTTTVVNKLH